MTWSRTDRLRFDEIIRTLGKTISVEIWSKDSTPFEVLISTILSQNTNRNNTTKAFERLKKRFKITPQELASADVEEIKKCIKPAGLYKVKGQRIKKIAQIIWEDYEDDLNRILNLPLNKARKKLLSLPGVGKKTADVVLSFSAEKTADVVLSFSADRGTFPVDRHIDRIARRLKLVKERAGYEEIRRFFERIIPREERIKVHLLLINFGRSICKARSPRCEICPVKEHCENEDIGQ